MWNSNPNRARYVDQAELFCIVTGSSLVLLCRFAQLCPCTDQQSEGRLRFRKRPS